MTNLIAVAVLALSAPNVRAEDSPHGGHMTDCAKTCAECMVVCQKTMHHCYMLTKAGKTEHAKAMHLAADCGEFCALSAKMSGRQSELAVAACEACAEACDALAAECVKFPDSKEMQECAAENKKCAASCREMVKMMGGHKH